MQEIAYLHVVINHLPIMGVPIGAALLLLALWQREAAVARAALLVFVGLGLATVAVYLTGQGGEDFIEHFPGRSHDAIEAHEEAAGWAFATTGLLAVASLLAWLRLGGMRSARQSVPPEGFPSGMLWLLLGLAALTSGVLGYTGKLGGRIAHVEFAAGAVDGQRDDDDGQRGRGRGRGRD